jgi:hypothetical protein
MMKTKYEEKTLDQYGDEAGKGLFTLLSEITESREKEYRYLYGINIGHLTNLLNSQKKLSGLIRKSEDDSQIQAWKMPYVQLGWEQYSKMTLEEFLKAVVEKPWQKSAPSSCIEVQTLNSLWQQLLNIPEQWVRVVMLLEMKLSAYYSCPHLARSIIIVAEVANMQAEMSRFRCESKAVIAVMRRTSSMDCGDLLSETITENNKQPTSKILVDVNGNDIELNVWKKRNDGSTPSILFYDTIEGQSLTEQQEKILSALAPLAIVEWVKGNPHVQSCIGISCVRNAIVITGKKPACKSKGIKEISEILDSVYCYIVSANSEEERGVFKEMQEVIDCVNAKYEFKTIAAQQELLVSPAIIYEIVTAL